MPITMQPVRSSNIADVGYSPESEVLHVRFKSGALWEYTQITPEKFASFINAPSIGGYYNSFIKCTPGRKVEDAPPATTDATLAADLAASVDDAIRHNRIYGGGAAVAIDANPARAAAESRRYVPPVLDDLAGPFDADMPEDARTMAEKVQDMRRIDAEERANVTRMEEAQIADCPRCMGLAPMIVDCPECAGIGSVSR